jgi:hypothetical protein
VRVSVKGGPATRLSDLVCTIEKSSSSSPAPGSPGEIISDLKARLAAPTRKKAVLQHQHRILFEYGEQLKAKNDIGPDQVASFLETFLDKAEKSIDGEIRLDAEISSLEKQIEEQERIMKAKVGEANGQVELILAAENEGQTELKLTYGMKLLHLYHQNTNEIAHTHYPIS